MQPTNQKERRKAFTSFLLLFVICVIIITTTVFFSSQVPFKQNEQLRKDISLVEKDREFSEKFSNEVLDVTGMLDTINTKASKPDLLDALITDNIKKLNVMVESDSIDHKALYKNIVLTLADLSLAKKQLRESSGKSDDASEIQKKLDDKTKELEDMKNENFKLQQQILLLQH